MNENDLLEFILSEINIQDMKIDSGIYETHKIDHKSIGISYEHNENKKPIYIVNIFYYDEYINVSGEYDSIYDCIPELLTAWNKI